MSLVALWPNMSDRDVYIVVGLMVAVLVGSLALLAWEMYWSPGAKIDQQRARDARLRRRL